MGLKWSTVVLLLMFVNILYSLEKHKVKVISKLYFIYLKDWTIFLASEDSFSEDQHVTRSSSQKT